MNQNSKYLAEVCEIVGVNNPVAKISGILIPVKDIITPIEAIHRGTEGIKGNIRPIIWLECGGELIEVIPF